MRLVVSGPFSDELCSEFVGFLADSLQGVEESSNVDDNLDELEFVAQIVPVSERCSGPGALHEYELVGFCSNPVGRPFPDPDEKFPIYHKDGDFVPMW